VLLSILAISGCQSPCGAGAFVDQTGGFCVALPSGYKRASANDKDGQDSFGFGPTGRMVMFVRRETDAGYAKIVKMIDERQAAPPDASKVLETGKTATSAFQMLQYKGQTTVELEYVFTDGKRFGRCTASYAKESEAREVLAACKTLRFTK
jgi:hypothetical protein